MDLTTRQKIERLWDDGYTARAIAERLGISTQGVYWHLERIREGYPVQRPGRKPREKRDEAVS